MYPVNQVILGRDSMFTDNVDEIDAHIQRMEEYKRSLERKAEVKQGYSLWNKVDSEVASMTALQKESLFKDEEYSDVCNKLQMMVQAELLELVKYKIEGTKEGKELLEKQAGIVGRFKTGFEKKVAEEMENLMRFREYSTKNPNLTYEEFLKMK